MSTHSDPGNPTPPAGSTSSSFPPRARPTFRLAIRYFVPCVSPRPCKGVPAARSASSVSGKEEVGRQLLMCPKGSGCAYVALVSPKEEIRTKSLSTIYEVIEGNDWDK
mmetsp:Transcript_17656/g.44861  ORF Transcript_17656/g.44861 Transcript_17656/m.44861 type:complete len:108 (+) Transcript_17656:837-1160(+)|eukprot:CAMPEP_0174894432 /NCGR_PEP_ID=MMETSP0167-20121228/9073_1 /TAXON_ID=38298 /ORGANISM="Rhodella maculata, Strain CCMP736" /LENGTH=107 /DNA_ID=CAMNT_0016133515 /DNA_START=793 /DNA_END=1116 /DNA_ORIENTATION=-